MAIGPAAGMTDMLAVAAQVTAISKLGQQINMFLGCEQLALGFTNKIQ